MLEQLCHGIYTTPTISPHTGPLARRVGAYMSIRLDLTGPTENLNSPLHVFVHRIAGAVPLMRTQPPRPDVDLASLCEHPPPQIRRNVHLMALACLAVGHVRPSSTQNLVCTQRQHVINTQSGSIGDLDCKRVFRSHCSEYECDLNVRSPVCSHFSALLYIPANQ